MVKASITRLTKNLESVADDASTLNHAQRIAKHLEALDLEFKEHHGALIDLISDDDLEREQETLDEHYDEMSILTVRVQELVSDCAAAAAPDSSACKISLRRLTHLQRSLSWGLHADADVGLSAPPACLVHPTYYTTLG